MLITNTHLEALWEMYLKQGHTFEQCQGFIDGYIYRCQEEVKQDKTKQDEPKENN